MVVILISIFFAIIAFLSLRKDRQLVGFYKSIGSYGRIYSYLLLVCLVAVVVFPIVIFSGMVGKEYKGAMIFGIIAGLAFGALLIFLLFRKFKEIPKGRVLWDYFIIALGTTMRVSLFIMRIFFKLWYTSIKPTAYTVDGKTVYIYPGSNIVYDSNGYRVGEANSDHTKAVMDS